MAASWAPCFARWRTPYIYIPRLVPHLMGARPLECQVFIWGPCRTKIKLCPIYPHGGMPAGRHLARWRPAHLFFSYRKVRHTNSHGGTTAPLVTKQRRAPKLIMRWGLLPPQNSKFSPGLLPPFLGVSNFHPLFLNFGTGELPLGGP